MTTRPRRTPRPSETLERHARDMIREAMQAQGITYKLLSRRLSDLGEPVGDIQLNNRINRGKFSFAFALLVLRALGIDSLPVPRLRSSGRSVSTTKSRPPSPG